MPKFPLLGKALALAGVLLALTLALHSVSAIVAEREGRLREAERSVAQSLAAQQTLVGPMLQRRCSETWSVVQGEGKQRSTSIERREFTLAATPASLAVNAKATIEPRYRGIFKVNGYALAAQLTARWDSLAALQPVAHHSGSSLRCDAPELFVAVGDARGIRQASIGVAGVGLAVLPGTGHDSHPRGFHALLPAGFVAAEPLTADVSLELAGTGALAFAAAADTTAVSLGSDWPHPSFTGRFLPIQRSIGEHGFSASGSSAPWPRRRRATCWTVRLPARSALMPTAAKGRRKASRAASKPSASASSTR